MGREKPNKNNRLKSASSYHSFLNKPLPTMKESQNVMYKEC